MKPSAQAAWWHITETGSWDSRKLLTYVANSSSKSQKNLSSQQALTLRPSSGEREEWRFVDATDFEVRSSLV